MQMYSSVHLRKWAIVFQSRDHSNVGNWIGDLKFVSRALNFRFNDPEMIHLKGDARNPKTYSDAVADTISTMKDCQLIFAVLPTENDKECYNTVKRACNISYGIQSQCFKSKNFFNKKGLKSIATKVIIQMNVKLGGVPWIVKNPFKQSHTTVIGFDVHHPGKGQRKGSCAMGAMVATTNNTFSRFYSTVSTLADRNNLSEHMSSEFLKCILAYQKVNDQNLPDRVFFYRDGVGQGDLEYVYNVEIKVMEDCLKQLYRDKPYSFNFIVCTKKGNARILSRERGSVENPAPGTVVDSVITLPQRFDFFLISQQGRFGQTVSPSTYNVLKLEDKMNPDRIQQFTHKLTHLYYNWSGTVAVPAVCQYAHKLSLLSGNVCGSDNYRVHENLAHYLYFL